MWVPYGDPARTGVFPVSGVDSPKGVRWRFDAGRHLVGGVAQDGDLLFVGAVGGLVTALDAGSGQVRWQRVVRRHHSGFTDADPSAGGRGTAAGDPAAGNLAGGDTSGQDGCSDDEDWTAEPLAVAEGRVFVNAEGPEWDPVLVALDRDTGAWVGEVTGGEPAEHPESLLVVNTARGVDPRALRQRWAPGAEVGLLAAPPAVADGLVVATASFEAHRSHGGLHVFDLATGEQVWQVGAEDDPEGNWLVVHSVHPIVADQAVWVPRWRGSSTEVAAFDLRTGKPRHVYAPDRGEHWQAAGALAAAGGMVYAVLTDGSRVSGNGYRPAELHALRAATGEPLWVSPVALTAVGSPVLAGGSVYLASRDGWVCALDALTGALRWSLDTGAALGVDLGEDCEYRELPTPLTPGNGVLFGQTSTGVVAIA